MGIGSHRRVRLTLVALFAVLALVAVGCGGGTEDEAATTSSPAAQQDDEMDMGGDDEEHDEQGSTLGEPGDPADADRTIEMTATDDFTFDPSVIEARVGETITFAITNTGQIPHDAALGDEEYQHAHEEEMAEMEGDMMHDEPNAVTIQPGDTEEITWTFTEVGTALIGCHQPGHYDAGMIATVTVSE